MKKIYTLILLLTVCGPLSVWAQTTEEQQVIQNEPKIDSIGKMLDSLFDGRYSHSTVIVRKDEDGNVRTVVRKGKNNKNHNWEFGFGWEDDSGFRWGRNFYTTASIELGYNRIDEKNLFNGNNEDNGTAFPTLNNGKSITFAIYPVWAHMNLIRQRLWFVSAIGFEWHNFRFNPNNSIGLVDGKITQTPSIVAFNLHEESRMKKSKLTASYLNIPVMLELTIPHRKGFKIGAGMNFGVNLGSHTKVKYVDEKGKTRKDKNHDDMYLSSFRYGFRAQVSYKGFGFYANYYMTPLFKDNRGPQVYPFVIGTTIRIY